MAVLEVLPLFSWGCGRAVYFVPLAKLVHFRCVLGVLVGGGLFGTALIEPLSDQMPLLTAVFVFTFLTWGVLFWALFLRAPVE